MEVRAEKSEDVVAVRSVNVAAFRRKKHTSHTDRAYAVIGTPPLRARCTDDFNYKDGRHGASARPFGLRRDPFGMVRQAHQPLRAETLSGP